MKITGFEKLGQHLGMKRTQVRWLYRRRVIRGSRVGHRTVIFDVDKVEEDLTRFEKKGMFA